MVKPKLVMLIGAGQAQIPFIRTAQKKGYLVLVTDYNQNAPGFKMANYYGIVSTKDPKATTQFALEFNKKHRIDGVMAAGVDVPLTVSAVSNALHLPGIARTVAENAHNKLKRHEIFAQKGIPSPRFISAHSVSQAIKRMQRNKLNFPVVFKPVDSAGSRGVQKITTIQQLENAISELNNYSKSDVFILEEFKTGTEHSSESVVYKGRIYTASFSDRNYDKKEINPPYFLEDGDTLPTALPKKVYEKTLAVVEQAIKALDINWGPAKGDIMVTSDGPIIFEMAPRLSADYFCTDTVPLHNGTHIMEFMIDLCLDVEPDLNLLKPKYDRTVALRYFWPKKYGFVTDIQGIEDAEKINGIHSFKFEPTWSEISIGSEIKPATSHGERLASVIAVGKTRQDAINKAKRALDSISIDTAKERIFSLTPKKVPKIRTKYRKIVTKIPHPKSAATIKKWQQYEGLSARWLPPVVWQRAQGIQVFDAHGNKWLDFSSGVLLTNAGHAPQEVVEAVRNTLSKPLLHNYYFASDIRTKLIEELLTISPAAYDRVYLKTTGAEVVELALRTARKYGLTRNKKKIGIVSFESGFHGRTWGARMAGGSGPFKQWITNFDPNFYLIPFPDGFRNKNINFSLFEKTLREKKVTGADIAGVIVEGYQGGNASFAPKAYMQNLRRWCDKNEVLLIIDEVQSGFGRTGKMFAFEHYEILPDLFCCGKGISGSLPLSAVIGKSKYLDLLFMEEPTSTHGGNPVCASAAYANLKLFRKYKLVHNADILGKFMHQKLQKLMKKYPHMIAHIQGKGLVAGIQVTKNDRVTPDNFLAWRIVNECFENGLLLFAPVGFGGGTIKLAPPLIITKDALNEGLYVLETAFAKFAYK
ncbi:aminotransferase class III-fold pyridoxal phosphate-dependent enzyme [Candidatus Microgenomates bacterium]|nr:MAG: aminotransferase class III-fold pyridoxal phosphate-dependent enzyme [Candidatus Microgenomates bacterium]